MITHRQLEAFRAVMLTRSMTGGGEILGLTQPAVSKLIRDLEYHVGFCLFTRRRRSLSPTPMGLHFHAEVERSYVGIERLASAAAAIRKGDRCNLRISTLPALATWLLPQTIASFLSGSGTTAVSLQPVNSPDDVELVATGRADLGFAMTPIDSDRVAVHDVLTVPCVCILPPGHRLADRKRIGLTDLADERFISLEEGTTTRLKIDAAFRAANVTRRLEIWASWAASIAGMVFSGAGVSIVDPFSARHFAMYGGVVRPLAENIEFSFAPIVARRTSLTPSGTLFLDVFMQKFEAFSSAEPDKDGPIAGGYQTLDVELLG